jgi:hypothetical protein
VFCKMYISVLLIASTLVCLHIKSYMNIVSFTLYTVHRCLYAFLYVIDLCVNGRSINLQETAVGCIEVNYIISCLDEVMKTSM